MSLWEIGWGVYLAGLPWAHFVLGHSTINQWYAQTFWLETGAALLFSLALAGGGLPRIRNRPLGWWFAWLCVGTVLIWLRFLKHAWGHPIGLLPPLIHLSMVMLWYVAAMTQWTPALLDRLVRWIALSGMVVVGYGVLQLLNLDQFYKWIDTTMSKQGKDSLIGTIGNDAYFGMHLAFLLPCFFWLKSRWRIVLVVVASGLAVWTRSTSALVCVAAAWLWWSWWELPCRWSLCLIGLVSLGVAGFIATHPFWLNPSGRVEAWRFLWQHYFLGDDKWQITGAGLGRVMADSSLGIPGWPTIGSEVFRHAHCEYLQVMIEQGVIGVVLVGWMVVDAVQRWRRLPRTALVKTLGGVGVLVLLAACVNNNGHYAILNSFGLLAYCGVYALSAQRQVS